MTEDMLARLAEEGRVYRRLGLNIDKMPPYEIEGWPEAWRRGWKEEDQEIAARPLPPPIQEPIAELKPICYPDKDEEVVIRIDGDPPSLSVYTRRWK